MWSLASIRKFSALALIVGLGLIVFYGLREYISFFLAAIVFLVLFNPLNIYFQERLKMPRQIAAFLVIIISVIVIVAPLLAIFFISLNQLQILLGEGNFVDTIQETIQQLGPMVNLQELFQSQISTLTGTASNFIFSLPSTLNYWLIGTLLMYFALYFLLVADRKRLLKLTTEYIPFNKNNSMKILEEFKSVTYAVLISNLLMAFIQASVFGLAFYLAGVQASIIWAIVAFVLSFLPIVGPILIAVPAIGVFLFTGNYYGVIIMLFLAIVLTLNDSFLRPIIQEKMGDIHPMVSVAGFIMGIVLFGMIGIVIGPILLSYFLISLKIFGEEYIDKDSKNDNVKIDSGQIFSKTNLDESNSS